jgi:glycosyltransferase involved in cell wall biosynthesis
MAPGARVITASNGVDFSNLRPGKLKRDRDMLVFVGHLAYAPNAEAVLWFAREILPLLRRERPSARFVVVGGGAPASLMALKGLGGIEFTGFMADFRPLLWRAAVSVCPVRLAAGRQNKILDAFACATPVVATPVTARGCGAVHGRHLLCAADAPAFAAQCLRLMQNARLGARLARAARLFVARNYDWSESAGLIESALKPKGLLR